MSFTGSTVSTALYPATSLIEFDGALYGSAPKGGPDGANAGSGTIFKLKGDTFTLLHAFAGYPSDAAQPQAGLVEQSGILYGTSLTGGDGKCPLGHHVGCGAVFAIEPSGKERCTASSAEAIRRTPSPP